MRIDHVVLEFQAFLKQQRITDKNNVRYHLAEEEEEKLVPFYGNGNA